MHVLKFGGTSVGTPERIEGIVDIIKAAAKRDRVLVVVSAFSQVTDQLIQISDQAARGDDVYRAGLEALKQRHRTAAQTFDNTSAIEGLLEDLENILRGVYLTKERTPRTLDVILSFGERLSATIVAQALGSHGLQAQMLDARKLVRTDSHFGAAHVDFKHTYPAIGRHFKSHPQIQVVTGFLGSTPSGETTTLGRGGSDYTAALCGAALRAKLVEIWTDVDGFLTADPRKVPGAKVIKHLRYSEAAELAHFGAKVLHPPTIRPSVERHIPIQIKNTLRPKALGTRIDAQRSHSRSAVTGITSLGSIALLQLQGLGMQGVPGIAARLFGALAQSQINVILITQASSEHSICVAIHEDKSAQARRAVEQEFAHELQYHQIEPVSVESSHAIVAIVGEQMRHRPGVAGQLFQALGKAKINVAAIAQGSSELNISLVVSARDEVPALKEIHHAFFKS